MWYHLYFEYDKDSSRAEGFDTISVLSRHERGRRDLNYFPFVVWWKSEQFSRHLTEACDLEEI